MGYFDNRDGRRTSDPLRSPATSPALAPDWQLSRVAIGLDAAAEYAKKSEGINSSHYEMIRFAITPMDKNPIVDATAVLGGTADVNVEIRVWSEQAQSFISFPTPLTGASPGAGLAYIVDVDNARGSIVGCFTSEDAGGEFVAISAQGFNRKPVA